MSLAECIGDAFRPNTSPEMLPIRATFTLMGTIGVIAAIAAKVFGTLSSAGALFLGGLSATVLVGGIAGSIGLIALPLIIGIGISMALPMPSDVVWVMY